MSETMTTAVDDPDLPWGDRLRRWRVEVKAWSQQEFVDQVVRLAFQTKEERGTRLDIRLVGKWENGGVQRPQGVYRRLLAQLGAPMPLAGHDVFKRISDGLSIPPGYVDLGRTPSLNQRVKTVQYDRRKLLGDVAALTVGAPVDIERWLPTIAESHAPTRSQIGEADVEELRKVTQVLWNEDQQYGGGAALDTARGTLTMSRNWLNASATPDVSTRLKVAIADLHNLVGWSYHDTGRHTVAEPHFAAAVSLGKDAEDLGMVSAALYRLGRVSLHIEQPAHALAAFNLGQMVAQNAGAHADLARFHVSAAWAYALMGKTSQMEDSFSRAEHELGMIEPSKDAPWASAFVRSGDWDGVRAMSYIILARCADPPADYYAERAVEIAGKIVSKPLAGRPSRSRVFDEIIYAAGHLHSGDRRNGLALAHAAVDKAGQLHSARAVDRLRDISGAAMRVRDDETEQLCERITILKNQYTQ